MISAGQCIDRLVGNEQGAVARRRTKEMLCHLKQNEKSDRMAASAGMPIEKNNCGVSTRSKNEQTVASKTLSHC